VNINIWKKLHEDGKEWKHKVRNEPVFNEEQNGIRRGRSCVDSMFTVQQILG
jgi:hypothetical protein